MQFHGTADRYTLNGATAVATLYSNATTATTNPAVTLRSVGTNGGQAAAFTYDLARSVVYTRQGNPAWAGQERDGVRADPVRRLFFGAKAGDLQPDWVDLTKVAIPQADEQQRLLANLITRMGADRKPLPRFWYLPRGLKAAVVMTGDDHASGGTAGRFDQYNAASPAGCTVADWECVRGTSYIYPEHADHRTRRPQAYDRAGLRDRACTSRRPDQPARLRELDAGALRRRSSTRSWPRSPRKFTSIPAPATNRTHCIAWSDWATQPKVELRQRHPARHELLLLPGQLDGDEARAS